MMKLNFNNTREHHSLNLPPEQEQAVEEYFNLLPEHIKVALAGMSALSAVAHGLKSQMAKDELHHLLMVLASAICPTEELLAAVHFHKDMLESLMKETKQ